MTPEQEEDAWFERQAAERERQCGRSITYGPSHDPYAAECERDRGHDGPHRGLHPLRPRYWLEWGGGGFCAGDPLPVRGMRDVPIPIGPGTYACWGCDREVELEDGVVVDMGGGSFCMHTCDHLHRLPEGVPGE